MSVSLRSIRTIDISARRFIAHRWTARHGMILCGLIASGAAGILPPVLTIAQAGAPEALVRGGRICGCGWSDGYHACHRSAFRPLADLPPRSFAAPAGARSTPAAWFPFLEQNSRSVSHRPPPNFYDQFDRYAAETNRRETQSLPSTCSSCNSDALNATTKTSKLPFTELDATEPLSPEPPVTELPATEPPSIGPPRPDRKIAAPAMNIDEDDLPHAIDELLPPFPREEELRRDEELQRDEVRRENRIKQPDSDPDEELGPARPIASQPTQLDDGRTIRIQPPARDPQEVRPAFTPVSQPQASVAELPRRRFVKQPR